MNEDSEKQSFLGNFIGIVIMAYLIVIFLVLPVCAGLGIVEEFNWIGALKMVGVFIIWQPIIIFPTKYFGDRMDTVLPNTYFSQRHWSENVISMSTLIAFLTLWSGLCFYSSQISDLSSALIVLIIGYVVLFAVVEMLGIVIQTTVDFFRKKLSA